MPPFAISRLRSRLRAWSRRARTPTILQMEALECGAASLAIVLAYYKRFVPLEELRLACGVSRDGSKAKNVLRVARTYGLQASGMRLGAANITRQPMPCIVFWNFKHFLVVEGFGEGIVYLNDPAYGPRTVSDDEFKRAYTGVALIFSVGPDFRTGGTPRRLLASLIPRIKGSEAELAFVMVASLALVIPGLAIPAMSKIFVDNYLIGRMDDWVKPLLIGVGVTALVRAALTWLQQSQLLRLEMRLALTSSSKFFWHVLRLPIEFFSQRYAGDISQRVESNDRIARLLAGQLATNAFNVVAVVFFLVVMFQYDWALTLVGIASTAINFTALAFLSRYRRDCNIRLAQDRGKLMATSMGAIQAIETIKATGAENDFFMLWSGYKAKVNNAEQELELTSRVFTVLPIFLNTLVTVIILGLGGARIMAGELTVGMLVAFQSLMASFMAPATHLMGLVGTLDEAAGDLARADDVLNYPVTELPTLPAKAGEPPRQLRGNLELRDVSFGYSRLEPPLIENFSLKIAPGERVAIVGRSGSGKSTVSKLVMGTYTPWTGQVLFDRLPRDSISRQVLSSSLSGVDQEVYLFEGTIRDNLSLWDSTIPEAELVRAARDAQIHDVIASRPSGYDASVDEGGSNFSGGQAQRLEIARALATAPRILVLDEATSALDPVSESLIDDSIRQRGCTCLIVAHRLSTIRDCDEIIVMDGGKIVERGTHATLLALQGHYQRLIEAVQ